MSLKVGQLKSSNYEWHIPQNPVVDVEFSPSKIDCNPGYKVEVSLVRYYQMLPPAPDKAAGLLYLWPVG